jgi:hypothetical protein
MAHSKEAHAQKPGAMKQFGEGHWEKDLADVETAGGRYASEMNTAQEYKEQVDKLAAYAKKHRMKY